MVAQPNDRPGLSRLGQQIRHAAGLGTDTEPRALSVVLDTFMRALPHTLRDITAPAGTRVALPVTGPGGGTWTVTAGPEGWPLAQDPGDGRGGAGRGDRLAAVHAGCPAGRRPREDQGRRDRRLAGAVCRIGSIVY